MMAGRLAYMKAELGITDAQTAEVGWLRDSSEGHEGAGHPHRNDAGHEGIALERLDARPGNGKYGRGASGLCGRNRELYGALSDDQKKKEDLLLGYGLLP